MLKKIAIIVFAVLSMNIEVGYGNDLQNAFGALTNSTNAGIYKDQVRGFATGGGYTVSFPQDRTNFINLTPPLINAGCGGIGIYFGGISYVSSAQFTALLKGIAADALGEALSIAIRTLCPVCATVLADLQKAAQLADQLALNQCGAAMALVDSAINSVPSMKKYIQGRASADGGDSGQSGGFLSKFSDYANDFSKAINDRIQDLQNITDPTQKKEEANKSPMGNSVWKYLAGMTDEQKFFIMSLVGTNVRTPWPDSKSASTVKQRPIAATMSPEDLASIFMFGGDATKNQNLQIMQCNDTSPVALWECIAPYPVVIKDSKWYQAQDFNAEGVSLTKYGFYGLSYSLMMQALNNVAANKPLGAGQKVTLPGNLYQQGTVLTTSFSQAQIEGFMSIAYVPLYRAINIAAFYPNVAKQLINNISEVVAAHYAIAYIKNYVLNLKKTGAIDSKNPGMQGLSGKPLEALQKSIGKMRDQLNSKLTLLLTNMQSEEAWVNQLNQVQSTIYQQIMRNGLDENEAFSLGVSGG